MKKAVHTKVLIQWDDSFKIPTLILWKETKLWTGWETQTSEDG